MKKLLLIFMCLFITSTLWAGNATIEDYSPWSSIKESKPAWIILDGLKPYERENALIEIDLINTQSEKSVQHAKMVEESWNDGHFNEAIELFQEFEDIHEAAIGIQWKEPIATSAKWGDDVQIGNRNDIYVVSLDVDNVTGNLFAALLYFDTLSNYDWSVNISTDGGFNWSETYTWGAPAFYLNDISAVVVGSHFYVGHMAASTQDIARMRRFHTSDGSVDAVYGFHTIFDINIEIRDVALGGNVDQFNNRVYYCGLLANDSIKFYWSDLDATSWTPSHPTIGNAERGLDLCWNENFSTLAEWCSYAGTTDSLYVLGWNGTSWTNFGNLDYIGTSITAKTSIAAYGDTIMSTFPHYDGSYYNFRYRVSYNGGTNWVLGIIANPSEYIGIMNDITGRNGDGFGVIYQNEGGAAEGFYRHRTYHLSPWTSPVSFADSVTRYNVKPAIERIESGVYGIIYVNYPHEFAYFDRTDWISGIDEETPDLDGKIARLLGNSPNPFNQNTTIRYLLANTEKVSLKIYDISGKLIKTLVEGYKGPGEHSITWYGRNNNGNQVPSGIYFTRLSIGNFAESKKMIFIK